MRGKRPRRGARHGEGQGARGARAKAGPSWAGPHRGSKSRGTHNHRSESKSRNENQTRLGKHAIKHDIRQKKYDSV
jgi:hypothetical protein